MYKKLKDMLIGDLFCIIFDDYGNGVASMMGPIVWRLLEKLSESHMVYEIYWTQHKYLINNADTGRAQVNPEYEYWVVGNDPVR